MCCIISGDPVEESGGKNRYHVRMEGSKFQVSMMDALACKTGPMHCLPWFCGQFIPFCVGPTQYFLRRKVLNGRMEDYRCCQGYYDCCCFKSGQCCEETCPDLCMCIEGCCCNSCAISASRIYVMEKYDLQSDECDYRLIRINNCLQLLACFCHILAIIDETFREAARIIDLISDIFYHCMTGCMTVQTAHEVNYQNENPKAVAEGFQVDKF